MRTPRNILSTRFGPWIDKGDPSAGPLQFVHLVHVREGGIEKTIDRFRVENETAGSLSEKVVQAAQDDAENNPTAISEEYGVHAYFGSEQTPSGYVRFRVRAAPSADGDDAGVGAFSEGANPRGQIHQGMRHIEALTRMHLEGISRHEEQVLGFSRGLMAENNDLRKKNVELFDAAEAAKDHSMERNLALFRIKSEEDRKTRLVESLIPALLMFGNAAVGSPIFPVNSQHTGLEAFKNMLRAWGPEKMADITSKLDPQERMFLEHAKMQIMEEDEKLEKERQVEAERAVKGIAEGDGAKEVLAKRDAEGLPRPSL